MKLKEYFAELELMIAHNPDILEYTVIYSHDDEGNEYQQVNQLPALVEIDNIEDYRHLNMIWIDDDTPGTNYNAIIIN